MSRSRTSLIACCAAIAMAALATPALAATGGHHDFGHGRWSGALFASPSGGSGPCTYRWPCSLQAAVSAAPWGGTVIAEPGTYDGGVVISTKVKLIGRDAMIDATTSSNGNGIQITGPGGSGSTVMGFTVEHAKFEGILVGTAPVPTTSTTGTAATTGSPVSDVKILDNEVMNNDAGFGTTAGQCFGTPDAPGDCGEAVHLVSVTDSVVAGNRVMDNAGGILLTDEFGPTSGNVISDNKSIDNTDDCGITLAGHATAVNPETDMPTGAAGVFHNLIVRNVVVGNGVAGQGAGILLGGGGPYAGVYGNVIKDNYAAGNGLSGITVHQHFVGDLNGNVIVGNYLTNDNLDGDADFATADTATTGLLLASGLPPAPPGTFPASFTPGPITGTVIVGNHFFDLNTGIWTLNVDRASTKAWGNHFAWNVTTPVSSH